MLLWMEWRLATRFLLDNTLQSLLILLGIAVGCAVIVFLSALIGALQDNLIEKTLGTQAHIRLSAADEINLPGPVEANQHTFILESPRAQKLRSIPNWQQVLKVLEHSPNLTAASPMVSGPAIATRGAARASVVLVGVDPARYRRIIALDKYLTAGRFMLQAQDAAIGQELANDLGLRVGDKLRVDAGDGRQSVLNIVATFALGVRELDERYVYLALKQAQTLVDLPGGVTTIELAVADIFQAQNKADVLSNLLGLKTESWMQTNTQLLNALSSQSMTTQIIRVFIAISVAFGIASVLAVSVVQRTREIGILRAIGATQGQMLRVFLIQGALLGLGGAMLGGAVGAALLAAFNRFGPKLFYVPLPWDLIPSAMLLATVVGVLAAAAPARRAARYDPAVAIRYV